MIAPGIEPANRPTDITSRGVRSASRRTSRSARPPTPGSRPRRTPSSTSRTIRREMRRVHGTCAADRSRRAGAVRICTTSRCGRSASGRPGSAVVEQLVLAHARHLPIGIPAGYRDSSGPDLKPAVTTADRASWPRRARLGAGTGAPAGWGCRPLGRARRCRRLVLDRRAVTATSMIGDQRHRSRRSSRRPRTLPTSAPSPITGSLMRTPSSVALVDLDRRVPELGSRSITSR